MEGTKKLSDVLYAVACDSRRKTTIIQCDRMRKSNVQLLSKETNKGIYDENDSHVVTSMLQCVMLEF